jgi:hypothetical protein
MQTEEKTRPPCLPGNKEHLDIIIYKRPLSRLFRKTFIKKCIRCDDEVPIATHN